MRHIIYLSVITLIISACTPSDKVVAWRMSTPDGSVPRTVSIDTMSLANPFIFLDRENLVYYMTGDGGHVWTSKNMHEWQGPYSVLQLDSTNWIGTSPQISAPEIHKYNGKYYYVATFTRPEIIIDQVAGVDIPRRSCQLLVADSLQGPYKPIEAKTPLLKATECTQSATFCTDDYNAGYIIYNQSWLQTGDGTVQIIRLGDKFNEQIGEPYIMFTASQNPWSSATDTLGNKAFSPVMDGPFLFDTEERELGILFSTLIGNQPALGVAYSEKNGGLDGPWHIEPEPLLTGGYGQPMLFHDYDGTLVMLLHKESIVNGEKKYTPLLFEVDTQYKKLKIKGHYKF